MSSDLAAMCAMCFQDWHETCPEHVMLGECCCGFEDVEDDEDEWR